MPVDGIELTLRTLLRSPNPRATDLLAIALEADEAPLRVGAARALAMRDDAAGVRLLVEKHHQLAPDAQAALTDLPERTPLVERLPSLIRPAGPKLARRASELAVALGTISALPAIVEAALWPDSQFGALFAADALRLAGLLERRLRAFDPRVKNASGPFAVDPAFLRRAAVNALLIGLERYGQHSLSDLLQALLLVTPADEPGLLRVLRTEAHPAYEPLRVALRTSRCRGALGVLACVLGDLRAPQKLLEIAAERSDREGLGDLLELVGFPVGLRVRENCQRVESFAWLEPERVAVLSDLSGAAQAIAVQLAAASGASRRLAAAAIEIVLRSDDPCARLAACRAIESLPSHIAEAPLRQAVEADDPAVVAAAVRLVRRKNLAGATGILVTLLDHTDPSVRDAAGRSLGELSFSAFRDGVDELPPEDRGRVGRMVAKADPMAAPSLQAELGAAAVSRRLKAIELTQLMGLEETLAEALAACLTRDKDVGVRAEAARLLGHVTPTNAVLDALVDAVGSRAAAVREAAQSSLETLSGQSLSDLAEVGA